MSRAGCQNLFGCVVRLHVVLLLREDDVEDGVGAAAGLVHVGRSHSPEKEKENLGFKRILLTHYLLQPSFDQATDASKSLMFSIHHHMSPTSIQFHSVTWPCFQSPSGPGCRCMK